MSTDHGSHDPGGSVNDIDARARAEADFDWGLGARRVGGEWFDENDVPDLSDVED